MIYKPHPHLPEQALIVGKGSIIDDSAKLDRCGIIALEEYVCICQDVLIIRHHHIMDLETREYHYRMGTAPECVWAAKPLTIGSHSWINSRCLILPSVVKIAPGTILGAGSILSKDIDIEGLVWAGNPVHIVGINADFRGGKR